MTTPRRTQADAPATATAVGRPRRRRRPGGPPTAAGRRALRPAVRARCLRRRPGGRPPRPAVAHPGPPGRLRPRAPGPPGGHRQRGGQRGRGRDPPPGPPRLLRRRRSASTCPPVATTPPASPSCPATPTRPPTPARPVGQAGRRGGARRPRLAHRPGRATDSLGSISEAAMPSMHQLFVAPSPGTSLSRCRPGPGHRPAGLRAAQAGRARDRQLLLRLAVGPDHHLQGDAHLPPAGRLLPRPVRRTGDQRPGPGPLPLLHQHLPVVAAGPPLPVPGPQRGDQHAGRQPQLDAGPGGAVRAPTSSPGSSGPSPS